MRETVIDELQARQTNIHESNDTVKNIIHHETNYENPTPIEDTPY